MSELKLIVGLGNPGKEYENTRHNVGFNVLDMLAGEYGQQIKAAKFNSLTATIEPSGGGKVILLKPQTFMNLSGDAVSLVRGFYKIAIEDMLVITDDMALPPGKIRLRAKGSAGGHNGLKDIIGKLGTQDFARLRIGIGQSPYPDSRNYVLGRYSGQEKEDIEESFKQACACVKKWLKDGIDKAMTEYNV